MTTAAPSAVTVVVPTRDRRAFLPELVAALADQTCTALTVVLVDDGSADGTSDEMVALAGGDPRFRLVRSSGRGPAAARNAGVDGVTTAWVAFTDDDCIPEPGWVEALLRVAAREGADVVQGRTVPDPDVRRDTLPWYSRSQHIASWSGRFQTCNLLVRASLLREAGGFDERFPPHGFGEDTDLGLRLVRAGAATAFAAEAVVRHRIVPMTFPEFVRRRYRWSQVVRLVAVNPDARSIFPHPYVAHRSHLAFWASLPVAGWAARAGHWTVPAAMAVAYGAVRARRSAGKGRGPLVGTAWGATEVAGVAASCIGYLVESVRHRRLLV